jgi:hypothetical protein
MFTKKLLSSGGLKALSLAVAVWASLPALHAVERTLEIIAPSSVTPGESFLVIVKASTNAGQGERIGFFQLDALLAGEETWTPICYLNNITERHLQEVPLTAGNAGEEIKVRVRVAFRDGLAGDVDYTGAAIRWEDTWENWDVPPAKDTTISIVPKSRN